MSQSTEPVKHRERSLEVVAANDGGASAHVLQTRQVENIPESPRWIDLAVDLPPLSFLSKYVDLARASTDAPHVYHLPVGLGLMSTVIGRNVYIENAGGFNPLCLNLYFCVLGPSGLRKTTALSMGTEILRRFQVKTKAPHKLVFPDDVSRESTYDILKERPCGVFVYSEFSDIVERSKRVDWLAGWTKCLADLYDCPRNIERRLRSCHVEVRDPCVSVWGASSLEWFRQTVGGCDFRGGFLARFFWIPASQKEESWAFRKPQDEVRLEEVVQKLVAVSEVRGPADFSDVLRQYECWFQSHERELDDHPSRELLGPIWTRLEGYAKKFAVLFSLSNCPDQDGLKVTEEAMGLSLRWIEELKMYVHDMALEDLDGDPQWLKDRQRILDAIQAHPGKMTLGELARRVKMRPYRRREVVEALHQEGEIGCEECGGNRKGMRVWAIRPKVEVGSIVGP